MFPAVCVTRISVDKPSARIVATLTGIVGMCTKIMYIRQHGFKGLSR